MTGLALVVGPLVAAAVGLLVGGRAPRLVGPVAVLGAATSVAVGVSLALEEPWREPLVDAGLTGTWAVLRFATIVDGLAVTVALMVGVVALLVQVYSTAYLRGEPRYSSYAAFISLFTAAMLAVVVAGDLLLLLVGWEVMGLCSYLLIGQHWERPEARAAAVKAFLVTKAGDVGFVLGIIVLAVLSGSFLIPDVVAAASRDQTLALVGALLLLLGVLGKSAQFPLHGWLPDAMAGPSPVSALIHAATMVAAGVYLVIRFFPLFDAAAGSLTVLAVIASVTMVGAALAALAQQDLKRVLAWSTVSQLAYMMAALAAGAPGAATFHLLTHAFFKALLFLAAGAVIHAVASNSMDHMGGLLRRMPVTGSAMGLALAALVGVPPLAGFFSKESVLVATEHAARGEATVPAWAGWLLLVSALLTVSLTAAYATRLWLRTFAGDYRGDGSPHEAPPAMRWPLVVLAVPTVGLGVLGLSASWLPTWSQPVDLTTAGGEVEAFEVAAATAVLSVALLLAGGLGVAVRWRRDRAQDPAPALPSVLGEFDLDSAYRALAVRPFTWAVGAAQQVDERVVVPAVAGVGRATVSLGDGVQAGQQGNVQRYLTATMTAVVFVVLIVTVAVVT